MIGKSRLYLLLLFLLIQSSFLFAQEKHVRTIDSAMAISPLYMPVSYTHILPHFFDIPTYTNVDTAIDRVHYYNEFTKVENLFQDIGINTQAHKNVAFTYKRERGFQYMQFPYPLYFTRQEDIRFYDLKTAYTNLSYCFGLPLENYFTATHAQNIKGVKITADMKTFLQDQGIFARQRARYFSGNVLVHYEIPSKIYGFRVSYAFNRFDFYENGGLADYTDSTSTKFDYHDFLNNVLESNFGGYTVNTINASSKTMGNDLLLQHYVNLRFRNAKINLGTLTHSFQYKGYKSSYINSAIDTSDNRYYYFSNDTTRDSLNYFHIVNTLQWSTFSPFEKINAKKYFIHLAAGLTHEYVEDKLPRLPFYARGEKGSDTLSKFLDHSFVLFARAYVRLFEVLDITGDFSYSFNGYTKNDAIANLGISWAINRNKQHYLGLMTHFYRVSPDYIFSYHYGNESRWDTVMPKQNVLHLEAFWTRQRIRLSFNYYMLHNYTILNENQEPFTLERFANIFQLNISTPFRIKNFGFNANLFLQYSDNEYIPVPVFAGKATAYYVFKLFKRKLDIQVGADLRYNTLYEAYAYSPVLRQFYHQEGFQCGNYLYLDANISIKVQRISIFFRFSNLLSGAIGYAHVNTPYYPTPDRRFQVGINWKFYD